MLSGPADADSRGREPATALDGGSGGDLAGGSGDAGGSGGGDAGGDTGDAGGGDPGGGGAGELELAALHRQGALRRGSRDAARDSQPAPRKRSASP